MLLRSDFPVTLAASFPICRAMFLTVTFSPYLPQIKDDLELYFCFPDACLPVTLYQFHLTFEMYGDFFLVDGFTDGLFLSLSTVLICSVCCKSFTLLWDSLCTAFTKCFDKCKFIVSKKYFFNFLEVYTTCNYST